VQATSPPKGALTGVATLPGSYALSRSPATLARACRRNLPPAERAYGGARRPRFAPTDEGACPAPSHWLAHAGGTRCPAERTHRLPRAHSPPLACCFVAAGRSGVAVAPHGVVEDECGCARMKKGIRDRENLTAFII
jgi:hypothetical protein